jgi:hypothetical protein
VQTCSSCQDLPTLQFLAHLYELLPSATGFLPDFKICFLMNFFTNFLFSNDGGHVWWGMGSSTIILKEYYIYVSNLIAIYSKGFFWIFLLILPICSIYRHGSQDGWSEGSSDIAFNGNPIRMIQAKFGLNWPSGFRGEDFWKSLQTEPKLGRMHLWEVFYKDCSFCLHPITNMAATGNSYF